MCFAVIIDLSPFRPPYEPECSNKGLTSGKTTNFSLVWSRFYADFALWRNSDRGRERENFPCLSGSKFTLITESGCHRLVARRHDLLRGEPQDPIRRDIPP
jgi:hypothetical protein